MEEKSNSSKKKTSKKLAGKDEPPKKRGRKPKDKVGTIKNTEENFITEENVILQLPVFEDTDTKIEIPKPNNETKENFMVIESSASVLPENPSTVASISKEEDFNEIIKKRETELQIQNNSNKLMLDYVESNRRETWPKTTTIPCLHDCHTFSWEPVGLPIKIEDGKCVMFGNFCSVGCAAAYNFADSNDSNVWERYSLLNYVYNKGNPCFIANDKLVIDTFGGKYSVDEFRNMNCKHKRVNVEFMPFIASIPTVEETNFDVENISMMDIDKEKIKKVTRDYKLKRTKPLPDFKNTLESSMKLKYV